MTPREPQLSTEACPPEDGLGSQVCFFLPHPGPLVACRALQCVAATWPPAPVTSPPPTSPPSRCSSTRITKVSPASGPLHPLFPLLGVLFPGLAHLLRETLPDDLRAPPSPLLFCLAIVTCLHIIHWLAQWLLLVARLQSHVPESWDCVLFPVLSWHPEQRWQEQHSTEYP